MSSAADALYKKALGQANALFFKDYEKALENFTAAATRYKLDRNHASAGEAFMRAGDCATKEKNSFEAAQAYVNAAHEYRKVDVAKAAPMLRMAIAIHIDNSRLGQAARLEKEFAETLEEDGQMMEALEHYKTAEKYFFAEDQGHSSSACLTKMAKILGEKDRFKECAELYERIGKASVGGALKHQAKDNFIRALMARAALVTNERRSEQAAECREALESYQRLDSSLRNTRETAFAESLVTSMEENDLEAFNAAVATLDEFRMLDDWKTHVLYVIKKNFEDLT